MRTGKKGTGWSQLWKRNAVVAAIALFVCAAVYLNWNYEQEAEAGKTLGQSTMVGSETNDPLVSGTGTEQDADAQTGDVESGDVETDAQSQTATTAETISPPPDSTASRPGTVPSPCSRMPPPGRMPTRP